MAVSPVGRSIIAAREAKGWTRVELARQLGVEQSIISKWEHGTRVPTQDRVDQMGALLGVTFAAVPAKKAPAKKAPAKKAVVKRAVKKAAAKKAAPAKAAAKKAAAKKTAAKKTAAKRPAKKAAVKAPAKKAPAKKAAAKKTAAKKAVAKKATVRRATKKAAVKAPAKKAVAKRPAKKAPAKRAARRVSGMPARSGQGPAELLVEVRNGQVEVYGPQGQIPVVVVDLEKLSSTPASSRVSQITATMVALSDLPQPLYRRAAQSVSSIE